MNNKLKLINTSDFGSTADFESNSYEFEYLQFCWWYTSDNKLSEKPQAGLNSSVYYVHGYAEKDRDTECIPVGKIVLDNKLNPIFKFYMKNPQPAKKTDKNYKVSFEVKLTGCKADLIKTQQQVAKLFHNYENLILHRLDKPDHYNF